MQLLQTLMDSVSQVFCDVYCLCYGRTIVSTQPPVELQKYHESAVDSETCVPCIRDRVTHETRV
jgi:hypothetical protein